MERNDAMLRIMSGLSDSCKADLCCAQSCDTTIWHFTLKIYKIYVYQNNSNIWKLDPELSYNFLLHVSQDLNDLNFNGMTSYVVKHLTPPERVNFPQSSKCDIAMFVAPNAVLIFHMSWRNVSECHVTTVKAKSLATWILNIMVRVWHVPRCTVVRWTRVKHNTQLHSRRNGTYLHITVSTFICRYSKILWRLNRLISFARGIHAHLSSGPNETSHPVIYT
jgi:hypothetical protein